MMIRKSFYLSGFTLVELVVVVIVIGILAATALPKFINLGTEARKANIDTLNAAINQAANLALSSCLVSSTCYVSPDWDAGGQPYITVDGYKHAIRYGYPDNGSFTGGLTPAPSPNGIAFFLNLSDFTTIYSGLYRVEFRLNSAPDPTNCKVSYTEVKASSNPKFPLIVSTKTGC